MPSSEVVQMATSDSIHDLAMISLIRVDQSSHHHHHQGHQSTGGISIHQLVQLVMRERLDEEERGRMMERVMRLITDEVWVLLL